MQQTTRYKLNLIEGGDTFSPEALNDNAKTTERELAALAAADAANKSELQAAVQSAQSAASAALAAHAADTTQHAFVKLGSVTIPSNSGVTFTVTNPNDYAMLVVSADFVGTFPFTIRFTVNGMVQGSVNPYNLNDAIHSVMLLFPVGPSSSGGLTFTGGNRDSSYGALPFGNGPAWSSIRTIGVTDSSAANVNGNELDTTFTVYGVTA